MFKSLASMSVFTAFGYVIGFGNQVVIASSFGTSADLDVYLFAFSLISFCWFFVGPIIEVSIPVLVRRFSLDQDKANDFFTSILNLIFVLSTISFIFIYLLSDVAVGMLSSDEPVYSEDLKSYILMLVTTVYLMALTMFLQAVLNAVGVFIAQAASKFILALVQLICLIILIQHYAINAIIISLQISLGVLLVVQVYILYKKGIKYRFLKVLTFESELLKRIFILSTTFGLSSVQLIYERYVYLNTAEASLAAFNYSFTLLQIPQAVLISGLVAFMWTKLMAAINENRFKQALESLNSVVYHSLIYVSALSVFIFIYSEEILYLLYYRGEFGVAAVTKTAHYLQYLIASLPFLAINVLLGRVFVALGRLRFMVLLNVLSFLVSVIALAMVSLTGYIEFTLFGGYIISQGFVLYFTYNRYKTICLENRLTVSVSTFFTRKSIISVAVLFALFLIEKRLAGSVFNISQFETAFRLVALFVLGLLLILLPHSRFANLYRL